MADGAMAVQSLHPIEQVHPSRIALSTLMH